MQNKEIKALLSRYVSGRCTEEEKAWVETWYLHACRGAKAGLPEAELKKDLRQILDSLPPERQVRFVPVFPRAAAAFILIAAAACLYVYLQGRSWSLPRAASHQAGPDILPGGKKATLVLDDGRELVLDAALNGTIADQPGARVVKTADGEIAYKLRPGKTETVCCNLLSTPRGGQYRLVLSDGTKVWLNAASSLRFPSGFGGKERRVSLTGEAYFEVAKSDLAFIVETRQQTAEVLGTHFNINAYEDEPVVRTTLMEGAVKVIAVSPVPAEGRNAGTTQEAILSPGQQSTLTSSGLRIEQTDPAVAAAWKDGLFRFENTDIEQVMRTFSRWYDVEVEFRGNKPDIFLWGEVYRDVNASQALEILAFFNLEYQILQNGKDKKIVISHD
ncbi:MAG TPA: FecR domain-containing protein [Anseongella sp.]|nr:FecR domain-containing protein [Anseongella sp.]